MRVKLGFVVFCTLSLVSLPKKAGIYRRTCMRKWRSKTLGMCTDLEPLPAPLSAPPLPRPPTLPAHPRAPLHPARLSHLNRASKVCLHRAAVSLFTLF